MFVGWENFLVLEVSFERDAARHGGGKPHVGHRTAARVGCEILFLHLFRDPTETSREAGESQSP